MNKTNATNMTNPEITIIIPTYNRAGLISQAIDSVLVQTYKNWELIVVDDASTDTTEKIVKKYIDQDSATGKNRIRYIKNETNLGISKTRNHGLREARGKYIAMLDSDDVWLDPEKLAKQVAAFAEFEKQASDENHDDEKPSKPKPLGIVGTWVVFIDENNKPIKKISFAVTDAKIRRSFLYYNPVVQSSVLFLKQAALDAGGYDENMATMEDHDLWLHIGTRYDVAILPMYATGYRVHSGSITKNRRERVAADQMTVFRRWKNFYPGKTVGFVKSYLRLIRAWIA